MLPHCSMAVSVPAQWMRSTGARSAGPILGPGARAEDHASPHHESRACSPSRAPGSRWARAPAARRRWRKPRVRRPCAPPPAVVPTPRGIAFDQPVEHAGAAIWRRVVEDAADDAIGIDIADEAVEPGLPPEWGWVRRKDLDSPAHRGALRQEVPDHRQRRIVVDAPGDGRRHGDDDMVGGYQATVAGEPDLCAGLVDLPHRRVDSTRSPSSAVSLSIMSPGAAHDPTLQDPALDRE